MQKQKKHTQEIIKIDNKNKTNWRRVGISSPLEEQSLLKFR